ncbi:iron uptake transporter permease EfeU [Spongisporangium articulatum]|uniref:Iron uptake transporter permease EfeU n=1 Tax=Spongisporangium articulatum TaxID=3362603 RepID=A0ABW8APJ2_9ACTN
MLATFVIGLREGLEAALIVSIVAAFLRKQGRMDLLKAVYVGILSAVGLCLAVGVALEIVSQDLPQKQQEQLETVIGAIAVGMVTYMVVWMRRHARELKGSLESAAGEALAVGSGWALVAMAFLAVLREGFETAVFLLAAYNGSTNGGLALLGAVLGVAVSVGLGYAMYRGGVRINLQKFFRATGVVLVLVAAGLVVSALHTAHEAGWLNAGQDRVFDFSAVIGNGTVQGALLTGVLGIPPGPVLIEVVGWVAYLLIVLPYVVWPPEKVPSRRRVAQLSAGGALLAAAVATGLFAAAPAQAGASSTGTLGGATVQLQGSPGTAATARVALPAGWSGPRSAAETVQLRRAGQQSVHGVTGDLYSQVAHVDTTTDPAKLSVEQLTELNNGRLPLGLTAASGPVSAHYDVTRTTLAVVEPLTGRVLDVQTRDDATVEVMVGGAGVPLAEKTYTVHAPPAAVTAASAATARDDLAAGDRRELMRELAVVGALLAAGLLVVTVTARMRMRSSGPGPAQPATAVPQSPAHHLS